MMTHALYRSQQIAPSDFLKGSRGSGTVWTMTQQKPAIPGPTGIDTQNRGHSLPRK